MVTKGEQSPTEPDEQSTGVETVKQFTKVKLEWPKTEVEPEKEICAQQTQKDEEQQEKSPKVKAGKLFTKVALEGLRSPTDPR